MIDMKKFCAKEKEATRDLSNPIVFDGFLYASNGEIIVRIPGCGKNSLNDYGPKFESIFERNPRENFKPLVKKLPAARKCIECEGAGEIDQCLECNGSGSFMRGTHSYCCQNCNNGEIKKFICNGCNGSGEDTVFSVKIEGVALQLTYLRMIIDLPNIQIAFGTKESAARFAFDGGQGLLMPMRDFHPQSP